MNRQIRKTGFIVLLLFGALTLNLVWIQLVQAEKLASDNRNVRLLLKEYAIERGAILTDDRSKTLAHSLPTPEAELKFLRVYPEANTFAHVTGYYSLRFGREGLERSYNKVLAGQAGVVTMLDLGDRLFGEGDRGDTLVLSLNDKVQSAALDALGDRMGAVVGLDPLNGEIVAMVSNPSFDPNPISQQSSKGQEDAYNAAIEDPDEPLKNRVLNETYPPGSTFKVVTAAAALSSGHTKGTSFPPARTYKPPQTDKTIGNFGGSSCGGDMATALRRSCNVYFARLGAELDPGTLEATARGFGFGETPPIDIRASSSQIPDMSSPAFAAQAAIGQFEVRATPLQMALVAAGISNAGRVPVPRLVREIEDVRGERLQRTDAETWREAISPEVAETIRQMMVDVVRSGTGTRAALKGVQVAGKTGTAQTGRDDGSAHAWFIAFAPADAPRLAIAVLIEASGPGGLDETGGRAAAPVAKAVFQAHREVAGW